MPLPLDVKAFRSAWDVRDRITVTEVIHGRACVPGAYDQTIARLRLVSAAPYAPNAELCLFVNGVPQFSSFIAAHTDGAWFKLVFQVELGDSDTLEIVADCDCIVALAGVYRRPET
jgi:hypothetical protein